MKKILSLFIATLAIALTLTACSPSINDYVKAVNEAVSEQDFGEGVTAEVTARGNVLVYTYTYAGIPEGTDLEAAGQEVVNNLEATVTASIFKDINAECSAVEGITYEYYTESGELIAKWDAPTK